jgi:hypothetical protein
MQHNAAKYTELKSLKCNIIPYAERLQNAPREKTTMALGIEHLPALLINAITDTRQKRNTIQNKSKTTTIQNQSNTITCQAKKRRRRQQQPANRTGKCKSN